MIKFYGYKKCSTSNKAQKWLDQHQVQYTFQDLIQNPPTKEEFVNWLTAYQDRGIKYFFNTHGQHYREQNLKTKINTMTMDEAATLLSQDGKLIKRPLVVDGKKLTCGFKEEIFQNTWL